MNKPVIAIVGRPNVGKSTLFNRLVGRLAAVVTETPGTTRDRIALDARWDDRPFIIVDTGGLEADAGTPMLEQVKAQVEAAIDASQCIIFLTDVRDGLTPMDVEVAERLRRTEKPVVLAVNKADNGRLAQGSVEFYRLGMGDPIAISAHHNLGIDLLMSAVLANIPETAAEPEVEEDVLALAIIGRVNVGKSSLLNAILGQERAIVSEIPGTTRDALDTPMLYQGQKLLLIDTAGIRRRGKVAPGVEQYSVLRSSQAIDRASVVLLVLDATELGAAQDAHIGGQVAESFKGMVIVVNKWDLAPSLGLDEASAMVQIRRRFKFAPYAPIRFVSALRGAGVTDALDAALAVYRDLNKTVPQEQLHSVVMSALAKHPLPDRGRHALKVYRVAQEGTNPPTIAFSVNDSTIVHFSYQRYLENRLREALGFRWCPLNLVFKSRRRDK